MIVPRDGGVIRPALEPSRLNIRTSLATSASALTILKPTGCCGGWNPQPHWGGGLSFGVGIDPGFSGGYGGGGYYAYRKVLIPNIGIVMKKTLVCT